MKSKITDITELIEGTPGHFVPKDTSVDTVDNNELSISVQNERLGVQFCKNIVDEVIKLKLPKSIASKPELKQVIDLQGKFETFTLQSMFKVIVRAMRLLDNVDIDDIYDNTGMIDLGKWNAHLMMQQNCMNLLAQFNMHVRRLPVALSDMIRDIESSQVIPIDDIQEQAQLPRGNTTSKSLAQLLREAKSELDAEPAKIQQPIQEPTTIAQEIENSEDTIDSI